MGNRVDVRLYSLVEAGSNCIQVLKPFNFQRDDAGTRDLKPYSTGKESVKTAPPWG